jgi:protein-S-isoprenylcysteine O-methyltransferase Ste14
MKMPIPEAESQPAPSVSARIGRAIFPRRLVSGLLAVGVAAAIVKPAPLSAQSVLWGLLVGLGLWLRAVAAASAGAHTRDASISAPRLVTGGPYGYVRNPIYLGTMILGVGMVGLIGDWRLIPLLVAACVMLYATIIPAEEQFLAGKFGEAFAEYRSAVPRLIPHWKRWKKAVNRPLAWRNARGDLIILAILVLIYALLRGSAWVRTYGDFSGGGSDR